MKILLQSATITDPNSPYNGKKKDILIENGIITSIENKIERKGVQVVDAKSLFVSPGWFDLNVSFCDPGYEIKEDIHSGCRAAAAAGFTGVALMPETLPAIHSKSEVEYIATKAKGNVVDVYPVGAVSIGREGKDMAELYDMYSSGAVAFSDGTRAIQDAGLLSRALLYAKGFNGMVMTWCEDAAIAAKGKMNEGAMSTELGMKGIPALAEELMVARNIYLAEYNDAPIHFSIVSTAKSVELIKAAKKKGLKVTADTAAHHLVLDDTVLAGFDSHYKVKPPLRTKADIKALIQGLKDGTIDAICSQHIPEDAEHKAIEFEIAGYGMIGLQTAFSLINHALGKTLTIDQIIEKIAINPRKMLGLPVPSIKEGEKANLTVFSTEKEWTLTKEMILSKSQNTPFINKKLKGKATAVINNDQLSYAEKC